MLSRRRLLLASAGLLLAGCADGGAFAEVESTGMPARPGAVGVVDPVRVSYRLRRPASVEASIVSPDGKLWPLRSAVQRSPGEEYELAFDGTVASGSERTVLPSGRYELKLAAVDASGRRDERSVPLRVEAVDAAPLELSTPTLSLPAITPDGDGVDDEVHFTYSVTKPATVEIWAYGARESRSTIQGPTRREPGEHKVIWDGSAGGRVFGGKRLLDGDYMIAIRARDEAGNVRYRETPLRIANGGIERIEIAQVTMTPTRLRVGDTLRVRIQVINSGETTVRTMGPPPDTSYSTSDSFSKLKVPGTDKPYEPVAGAWRVGVGWQTAGQELPLRWGLLRDATATLPPGGEATVEVSVRVDANVLERIPPEQGNGVRFFAGSIREGVGLTGGRVGDHLITVER